MRRKKIFLILALLCAIVQTSWAQANLEEVYAMTGTTSANWTALTEGSTLGKTIGTVQERLEDDLVTRTTICHIYAYCLMPNHVHLLLGEKRWKVGDVITAAGITIPFPQCDVHLIHEE